MFIINILINYINRINYLIAPIVGDGIAEKRSSALGELNFATSKFSDPEEAGLVAAPLIN